MSGTVTNPVPQEVNQNSQWQGALNREYQAITSAGENYVNHDTTNPRTVENNDQVIESGTTNGRQDINPREAINAINQFLMQNIQQEYRNTEREISCDRQFFAPQMQRQQANPTRSKAVQVDHVEKQCVTRRNTFSSRNPLYIQEKERPVFMNNYYAGDNPQHMFRDIGQKNSENNNYSNFCSQRVQLEGSRHDKASQSSDGLNVGVARMHRMEETYQLAEIYHPSQDPPVIVQPNKNQEFTPSSTKSYRIPDYSVPPPTTHTYKSPPDDSLLQGQATQAATAMINDQRDQHASLLETIKRVTSAVEQQVILSGAQAEHSIIQNNNLFQELIKAQNKRDLDPALMSILMFMGEDSSQCLDWITRIKNVCVQSGRSL